MKKCPVINQSRCLSSQRPARQAITKNDVVTIFVNAGLPVGQTQGQQWVDNCNVCHRNFLRRLFFGRLLFSLVQAGITCLGKLALKSFDAASRVDVLELSCVEGVTGAADIHF